jgi:hypothetical protein
MTEIPTIRTTPTEMHTEQFWAREIDPIAHTYAFDATQLEMDPGDRHAHLLKTPGGQVIAIVRTDSEPLCCPYHERFPTISLSCERARTSRSALGWDEVYGGAPS